MLTHRRKSKHKIHLNFLNDDVFTQKEPKLEVSTGSLPLGTEGENGGGGEWGTGDGGGSAEQKRRRNCGIKEGSREPEEHARPQSAKQGSWGLTETETATLHGSVLVLGIYYDC